MVHDNGLTKCVMGVIITHAPQQAYKYRPPPGHQKNFALFSYRRRTIKTPTGNDNSRALNLDHTRSYRTQDNIIVPARSDRAQHILISTVASSPPLLICFGKEDLSKTKAITILLYYSENVGLKKNPIMIIKWSLNRILHNKIDVE